MWKKTACLFVSFLILVANFCFADDADLPFLQLLLGNSQIDGTVISEGQIWMDRNLGAFRVATSFDDSAAYGDLYQWGRLADGHESRTSSTTTATSTSNIPGHGNFIIESNDWRDPQNTSLWQGVSGINNPCPFGFRLPTDTELAIEIASWISSDRDGAFASPLKLVAAGYRNLGNDNLYGVGIGGSYWSSAVDGLGSHNLGFNSSNAFISSNYRAHGFSVRCLKD